MRGTPGREPHIIIIVNSQGIKWLNDYKKSMKTGKPFREKVSTEKHRILGSTQPTYEGLNSLYAQSFSFTITPFHQQGIKESHPPGLLSGTSLTGRVAISSWWLSLTGSNPVIAFRWAIFPAVAVL